MHTVSIFIPAFNAGQFITASIQSVIDQTYTNWELLIVDDNSSDDTYARALIFTSDNRIKVERNHTNLGMVGNWNRCIKNLAGEFLVKLDADDHWHSSMLEKSIAVMNKYPKVGLVFSKYINVDHNNRIIGGSEIRLPEFAREKPLSCVNIVRLGADKMLQFSILRQGVSLFRREVVERVGVFSYLITKDTQASSDVEFYFRVGAHYDIFCIDEVLYFYRIHSSSISKKDEDSGLSARKLYELKSVINAYYHKHSLITASEYKLNHKLIEFEFLKSCVYRCRIEKKYDKCLLLLLKMFTIAPASTLSFYFNRAKFRISDSTTKQFPV